MRYYILSMFVICASQLSAQNVGINTTSPQATMHVKGNADTSQLVIDAGPTQTNVHPLIRLRNAAGADLMHIHSDASANVFMGYTAGRFNKGLYNTFIGSNCGYYNAYGAYNTGIGRSALYQNNEGDNNTAVGFKSLFSTTTGEQNTAVGSNALLSNITGDANTATGFYALLSNVSGYDNTAMGHRALTSNTDAIDNTAIGSYALQSTTTGDNNTAMGWTAGSYNTTGAYNAFFGGGSGYNNTTGTGNTALGASALGNNTTGHHNTAVGNGAVVEHANSSNNVIVGAIAHVSGSNNTAIGKGATIVGTNNTVLGYGAYTNGNNIAQLGSTTTAYCGGYTNWTTFVSDARLKTKVTEDVKGLSFIMRLRPVIYNIDLAMLYKRWGHGPYGNGEITAEAKAIIDGSIRDKENTRMSGFIAQEVETAALETGYNFDGIKKPANDKDNYGLSYSSFVVPLVKAVQEQQALIQSQQKQIDELKLLVRRLINEKE